MCFEMIDVYIDISLTYDEKHSNFDNQSSATITLSDETNLLLKEVDKCMALICVIKDENYDSPYIIDYNIDIFRKGMQ